MDKHYPAPLVTHSQYEEDLTEALRIPLPPSSTCSENSHESLPETDRKSTHQEMDDSKSIKDQDMEAENPIRLLLDTSGEEGPTVPSKNIDYQDDGNETSPHSIRLLPLEELIQAVRKEHYEQDCLQSLQRQVHELMYTCTLLKQSIIVQSQLYRLMIDQYSLENKENFDLLYRKSLKVQRWPKILEHSQPRVETFVGKSGHNLASEDRGDSWIDKLSVDSRQTVVDLLREIRINPDFLSSRLATLSNLQLGALARSDQPRPNPRDSILSSPSYRMGTLTGDSKTQYRVSGSRIGDLPCRNLQDTPLSLLLNTVFDEGSGQSQWERNFRYATWSSTCAQIVLDGKHGSNELIVLILDEIANSESWPLALRLESYLTDLIQDGAFLLDSTANQHVDFTRPQESSNAQFAIAISEYFDSALLTFIKLINSELSQAGMSKSMLDFICAVLHKVRDPKKRIEVRNFIVSRWLCGSFLSTALIWPEVRTLF